MTSGQEDVTPTINDQDAARDLRVDTDTDTRERLAMQLPAAPDFTKLKGPSNKFTRRLSGRKN